jgi:hypothetical protein
VVLGIAIPGPEHTIVQARGNKLIENTERCDIFPVGPLSDNFEIRTSDLIKMSFYTDVIRFYMGHRTEVGILSLR